MSNWKHRERQAAKRIGALRNIGSGSQGRPDKSSSDTTHPRLYVELKSRKKHTCVTLWDDTKTKALKEHKVPVVMLTENGRPGFWVLVHEKHLQEVAKEFLTARSMESTEGETNAGTDEKGRRERCYQDPIGRGN